MNIHEKIANRVYLVAMVKDRRQIILMRRGMPIVTFSPMVTGYSVTAGIGCAFLPFSEVVNEAMYVVTHNEKMDLRERV